MSLYAEIVTALKSIPAFGDRVGLDRAAEGETFPYVTFQPEIDSQIALVGDAEVMAYRMSFIVDTWELADNEDVALRKAVVDALDGLDVRPAGDDPGSLRLRVENWQRVSDPDPGIVHRVFAVGVVQLA